MGVLIAIAAGTPDRNKTLVAYITESGRGKALYSGVLLRMLGLLSRSISMLSGDCLWNIAKINSTRARLRWVALARALWIRQLGHLLLVAPGR